MKAKSQKAWQKVTTEYGMLFVLLVLIAVLSILTLQQQHPIGADGGSMVARTIAAEFDADATVVVITESTPVDIAFADTAQADLLSAGLNVAAVSSGSPLEARRAIEAVLQGGRSIDVVATTADTAAWSVFERFEELNDAVIVQPAAYLWPTFARSDNLLSVANQTAVYAIIAIGMTMVIITAGIDLSVGSLVALAAVSTALWIRKHGGVDASGQVVLIACLLGMGICGAAGIFNGAVITRFGIPPFIATLAMMMMARGLARKLSAEEAIEQLPASFKQLSDNTAGIPNPVLLMIVLYVVAHLVMSRTVFGRYVYAVGGNPEAARLSGVRVRSVVVIVYTICGALAGLGGIVQSAKLGAGDPKLGVMLELDVIAAVVVGGTSLMGGEGRIFGTLIGAFIIAVMRNGMNLMNIGSPEQSMVLGAVVLAAVLIDTWKRQKGN